MHPEAFRVLLAHGMGCAACLGASDETVAECALMRGIPADVLVAELNAVLQHPSAA
jgi:hybrid cluster-associated redox disulfide protein